MENEQVLQNIIEPWYKSIKNPEEHQHSVLVNLVKEYQKTRYGQSCQADDVGDIQDFTKSFPVLDYKALNPYFASVLKGDYESILPEPPVCWVMTRGSTGSAKVLPVTRTHLTQIFSCGSRALVNYILRKRDFSILQGQVLNFNLPSSVYTLEMGGRR
ncbi:MAG: GH3 auxin-responsive promoter family protein [Candidatus Bathyarchaeota archaeon]